MDRTIDRRFRGPNRSGNGGYVCGVIAEAMEGAPATVRLHAPPPLDVPLTLEQDDDRWFLRDGETIIGSGSPAPLSIEPPEPPSLEEAREAVGRYAGREEHVFPECFVCGIDRGPPEALGIHPGPVPGRDLVAAPWTPPDDFALDDGTVRPAIAWAALDCPSYFGMQRVGLPAVLGTLHAAILEPIWTGDEHIVIGWRGPVDGRKHIAGSAIFSANGQLLAKGRAIWVELSEPIEDGGVAGT